MSIKHKLLASATALTLTMSFAACGNSKSTDKTTDKPAVTSPDTVETTLQTKQYLDAINAAQDKFIASSAKLNLAGPESATAFQKDLKILINNNLNAMIVSLRDKTSVPKEVKSEHQAMVATLLTYKKEVNANLAGLSSKDQDKTQKSALAIQVASKKFSTDFVAAVQAINTKVGLAAPTS